MSDWTERYRIEGTTPCIDIRFKSVEQLFDSHDPAPLAERDLDIDAVAYLVDAADEIPATAGPLKVAVWLSTPLPSDLPEAELRAAFARHFEVAVWRLKRRMKQQRSQARAFTLLGLMVLGVLLVLAEVSRDLRAATIGHLLPEGLTILAWVIMWRPLESLIYDWWPLAQERKPLARIGQATVEVHIGTHTPTAAGTPGGGRDQSGHTS